ncbi:N-acetylmuramoyl-L-alanine amidase family protein [Saccharibacillus sp. JS10]|uniref:N-acetylmuramoyl-L-alanine amidase family protein n=1 Tax=Saccharibacillus sp. JS10 TaxID=2950552 RepID=UPI00210A049D|nr:N-acetylmuramoyl-L-alanine amidase family protein [Saccharibacillus sp. JS10]MCQ4088272.1 N-acetylmuramoyl-L-alanine amidase family protein [Saccharibacillus sp. JS10]
MKFGNSAWQKTLGLCVILMLAALFLLPNAIKPASAAAQSSIVLDGQMIDGAEPLVVKQTTMVPIRVVSQQLGYLVNWNQTSGQITIGDSSSPLVLTIGSTTANSASGSVQLEQPPFVRANTTYVPLRFVGSQMGLGVKWEQASSTVYLQSPAPEPQPSVPPTPAPSDNVNNASIDSISFSDNRLTISANQAVTPKSSTLTAPDRIVVDLPSSAFGPAMLVNSNLSLGQVSTLTVENSPLVKQVRYSLFSESPSTVRVVIDLKQAVGYNIYNEGNLIFVDLNQQGTAPPIGSNGKKIVVIDPGHGYQDPGGIGFTGVKEKDMVLQVGLKVAALLKQEPNIDLIMTRSGDTYPTLDDRAKIANDANADVFLSIHGNKAAATSAAGTETYYADAKRSKKLSDTIQKHVQAATGFRDRGSKQANFVVIRKTTMPGALVEIGFLSNQAEEAMMMQDDFQQRVALAIVAGLKEYLGV